MMAKSAQRLALLTKSSEAMEDAARYQYLALRGLNQAIISFSRDNADAVLCSSICFQYNANDWQVQHQVSQSFWD